MREPCDVGTEAVRPPRSRAAVRDETAVQLVHHLLKLVSQARCGTRLQPSADELRPRHRISACLRSAPGRAGQA